MSKYVQIDIRLVASYGPGGLKGALPNLYDLLKNYRYELVIEKEPSPYEMVEVLIRLRNDPNVPRSAKEPIVSGIDELVKVRDEARELLLSRRLNELDRVLYTLEDRIAELDSRLG